jgi:cellulose synthase/poly-beta-1,6-N-acetylglucosamine synthase-like glycosyltransferase
MNMLWLPLILLALLNIALLPFFLLLLAATLAALFSRRQARTLDESRSKFLVVIPAHNEESTIAVTVRSCLAANYPPALFSVLVIADNCSDRTAAVAGEAGSRVVERFDTARKSKGYAIEYLIERLQQSGEFESLDALVVIDADTTMDANLLVLFDQDLRLGHDWIQCYYTVANPDLSWRTRLMTYAFGLFNGVLPLGLNALGISTGFRGNGMCFSTRGLRRKPWRSYGLVEDMEFSWALRIDGETIAFEPDAAVRGEMLGSGGQAAANQRRRWEFGRNDVRRKYLPLVVRSDRLKGWEKLVSACELMMPSMAGILMLFLIVVGLDVLAVWSSSGTAELAAFRWLLVSCAWFMTIVLGLYAMAPFWAMRLSWSYLPSLAYFPFYLGWKLLVALGGRPKEWVRTARESRGESLN